MGAYIHTMLINDNTKPLSAIPSHDIIACFYFSGRFRQTAIGDLPDPGVDRTLHVLRGIFHFLAK